MKRFVSLTLSIILICSVLLNLQILVSADSMYIKKVVSIVYDDSTSMNAEVEFNNEEGNTQKMTRRDVANYAVQTFCGMLNSNDELYITYMSEVDTIDEYEYLQDELNKDSILGKMELSSNDSINESVKKIKDHSSAGATKIEAVEVAYDKLKKVWEKNNGKETNTQYWLVVFTDGEFSTLKYAKEIEEYFKSDNVNKDKNFKYETLYLGIGIDKKYEGIPDNNKKYAKTGNQIIGVMSEIADRVSGRKRLEGENQLEKSGENKIKFFSGLPLQNIVVFEQNTYAEIEAVILGGEAGGYDVSRDVSVEKAGLQGRIFLIEDKNKNPMSSGTYEIVFKDKVDLSDIVVLFEPALKIVMNVSINGNAVQEDKIDEAIKNVVDGDEISVSYTVCELNGKKIEDEVLEKSGAKFDISVLENGKEIDEKSTGEKTKTYKAKNDVETEIIASVTLDGFAPIKDSTGSFKPHYEKVNYSIVPECGNGEKSIKIDDLANNKDFTICFTVLKDGQPVTDPEIIKSLNPKINIEKQGEKIISDDGKIIFTPKSADEPKGHDGKFKVEVTCDIDDGKENKATCKTEYFVHVIEYTVESVDAAESVRKTRFFGNKAGVTFCIKTENGDKLPKSEVENGIEISLNEEHSGLKFDIPTQISPEGDITVVPYSEEEHNITFWNWWVNWAYYFSLPGEDVEVTLKHPLGTGVAKIDVTEETLKYQILNVYLPLLIELAVLATFITWLVLVIKKPRFMKNAVLYVGDIMYNAKTHTHTIYTFDRVKLDKFNNIWKKENGRLKFKAEADIVSANGIRIRADYGGRIICEMEFPWFKSRIKPLRGGVLDRKNPQALAEYFESHYKLDINAFAMETVEGDTARALLANTEEDPYYFGIPDHPIDTDGIIKSGQVIIYTME